MHCVGCGKEIPDNILRDMCIGCANNPHLVTKRKRNLPDDNYINIIINDTGKVECYIGNRADNDILHTRVVAYREECKDRTVISVQLPEER